VAAWIVLGLVALAVAGVASGVLSLTGGVGLAVGAAIGLVVARSRRTRGPQA
jgi:hypothetical protein